MKAGDIQVLCVYLYHFKRIFGWDRPVYLNSLGLVYSIHQLSINLSFLLYQSLVSLRPYSKTFLIAFHTFSLKRCNDHQTNFLTSISVSITYTYTKCQKILNNNTFSLYCGNLIVQYTIHIPT